MYTAPDVIALVEFSVGTVSSVVSVADIIPSVSEIDEIYFPDPPTNGESRELKDVIGFIVLLPNVIVPFCILASVIP